MSDITKQIEEVVVISHKNLTTFNEAWTARRNHLYAYYEAMKEKALKEDEEMIRTNAEVIKWNAAFRENLRAVFTPGTVMHVLGKTWDSTLGYVYTPTIVEHPYTVVQEITRNNDVVFLRSDPPKSLQLSYQPGRFEIIDFEDMPIDTPEQRRLKAKVGRLIAKARLKDW